MKSNGGEIKLLLYFALLVNKSSHIHILCQNIMESSTQLPDAKYMNQMKMENNVMLDILNIPQGQLKGLMMKSRIGREYYSFRRIPYANPPRRFEPAEPPIGWHGVLDATKAAPICPQILLQSPTQVEGQEDCLFLSVDVPKSALNRKNIGHLYPVIVYIHEGAFLIGSGDAHGGEFFMDEDVLLVTFNYRVGALGFLSTGDGEILGNMGLKDQVLALKWVQANIHFFGGDPRRVTIYGESAGAASAQLHMLSPVSAGLFSGVIAHSGSALVPWTAAKNPAGTARTFGEKLGCNATNSRDLANCLKAKDYNEIINAQIQLKEWHQDPLAPFPPTVEVVSTTPCYNQCSRTTFLSEHPYQLILEGRFQRVPMLTGINKDEGLITHAATILLTPKSLEEINNDWNRIAPITLMYDASLLFQNQKDLLSQKIKSFYFGNKMIGPETKRNLTNMYSDRYYYHGVQTAAFHFAKYTSVYPFHFSYQGRNSQLQLVGINEVDGVSHADDLFYFFNLSTSPDVITPGSRDEIFSKRIVKLWVSFAYYGKPMDSWMTDAEWLPVQPLESVGGIPAHYYDLNMEFRRIESPFTNRMHFWNRVMDMDLQQELNFFP